MAAKELFPIEAVLNQYIETFLCVRSGSKRKTKDEEQAREVTEGQQQLA
ncbi:MAG: hypothetical protein K8R48_00245 [Alphaproteobacteria bacterium]|nr:hypothetical protein [Alphaproteobacteria bacterium]